MIGSSLLPQTAHATQQAVNANIETCKLFMSTFNGGSATPEQAQLYAQCVRLIYPVQTGFTPAQLVVAKIAVLIFVIGAIVGAWKGYHKHIHSFDSRAFMVFHHSVMWGGIPAMLFVGSTALFKLLFL